MPTTSSSGTGTGASSLNAKGVLSLAPMDITGVDPLDPTGLIKRNVLLADLEVKISMWGPGPVPLDSPHILDLILMQGATVIYTQSKTVTAPPPPFPIEHVLYIPTLVMQSLAGLVQLYYVVTDSFGGPSELDPKRTLTIDQSNPELLDPADHLEFVVPPSPAVDETYLLNNDPVALHLLPYTGRSDGDDIHLYLSNSANPPVAGPDYIYKLVLSSDPLIVYLPADKFRVLISGAAFIFYRIFDRAGYFSVRSAGLPFQLSLIPLPGHLVLKRSIRKR